MEVEVDVKNIQCVVCFSDGVNTPIQCEYCGWKCCDECAKKWANKSNTCMQCRAELFEVDESKEINYYRRRRCIQFSNKTMDYIATLIVFFLIINYFFYTTGDDDWDQEFNEKNTVLFMFSLIGICFTLLLNIILKKIILHVCCDGNITGSYSEFHDYDSDEEV